MKIIIGCSPTINGCLVKIPENALHDNIVAGYNNKKVTYTVMEDFILIVDPYSQVL